MPSTCIYAGGSLLVCALDLVGHHSDESSSGWYTVSIKKPNANDAEVTNLIKSHHPVHTLFVQPGRLRILLPADPEFRILLRNSLLAEKYRYTEPLASDLGCQALFLAMAATMAAKLPPVTNVSLVLEVKVASYQQKRHPQSGLVWGRHREKQRFERTILGLSTRLVHRSGKGAQVPGGSRRTQ